MLGTLTQIVQLKFFECHEPALFDSNFKRLSLMLGALSVLSGVDIPYHMEKDKSLSCLISIPFFL